MFRICIWCGRPFEAQRKTAKFCGPRCRKAHNRAKRGGIRLSAVSEPPERVKASITEDDIARSVVQAKGSMAVFDSARKKGPKDMRPMCARLADGMADLFRGVGL